MNSIRSAWGDEFWYYTKSIASQLRKNRNAVLEDWWHCQFDRALLGRYGIIGVDEHTPEVIRRRFLEPLFELLLGYIETGEESYREVYLDERLRYAPHSSGNEVRACFFEELLYREEQLLRRHVAPSFSAAFGDLLTTLHAPLRFLPDQPLKVLGIGDLIMNEMRACLSSRCAAAGLTVDFRAAHFHAPMARKIPIADACLRISALNPELIAFSLLTYRGLELYYRLLQEADALSMSEIDGRAAAILVLLREYLEALRQTTDAPFLLHNVSGLPLTRYRRMMPLLPSFSRSRRRVIDAINEGIAQLAESIPRTILMDEWSVANTSGFRACSRRLIPRSVTRHAFFQHTELGGFLVGQYVDVLRSYDALSRAKVLLVDFDNTLWEGVMAEGPVVHRKHFQSLLLSLKNSGILLVALSKNSPANIRWSEMVLKPEDFVLHKISWDLKVNSIREAAEQLQLGLNTFVVIDDNPVERELIRQQFPVVKTLNPLDPSCLSWLLRMQKFPNVRETEESRARTELYRQQVKRKEALSASFDYSTLMASLGLEARFGPAAEGDLERIAELVERTNQFNTTTVRYKRAEILGFLHSNEHGVYVTELSDKFGKVGIVGCVIVERRGNERVIKLFVMSCRAMGFELERLMLAMVIDAERDCCSDFIGIFKPTDRNAPASTLFSSSGFIDESNGIWRLPLKEVPVTPLIPDWFLVLDRTGAPVGRLIRGDKTLSMRGTSPHLPSSSEA